MNLIEL